MKIISININFKKSLIQEGKTYREIVSPTHFFDMKTVSKRTIIVTKNEHNDRANNNISKKHETNIIRKKNQYRSLGQIGTVYL